MQPEHRIDELIVDLSFTTTRLARHEQALLSDWLSEDLLPALDRLFSRYSPGQQVLRFETLEFDFGNLTNRNYQQSIREQLLQKFAQLLQTQLLAVMPAHVRLPEHTNSGDNPNARIALTQLFNYLASGQLSAHQPFEQPTRTKGRELTSATRVNPASANSDIAKDSDTSNNADKKYAANNPVTDSQPVKKASKPIVKQNALHEQLLDAVIAQHNIAELLRELPQRDALVQRLLTQFSVPQRLELLRQLAPQQVYNAITLLDLLQLVENNSINAEAQHLDSNVVWRALLQLGLEYPQANLEFWLRHIFRTVSVHAAIDSRLLKHYLTAIKIPFSSAATPLINMQTHIAQLSVGENLSTSEPYFAVSNVGALDGQAAAQQANLDQFDSPAFNPAQPYTKQLNPEQSNSEQLNSEQRDVEQFNTGQLRQLIAAAFIRADASQLQKLWPQLIASEPQLLLAALAHYLPQAEIRQLLMLRLPLVLQAEIIALLAPAFKKHFFQLHQNAGQLIKLLAAQTTLLRDAEGVAATGNAVESSAQSPELLLRQLWEIALGLIFNDQSAVVNADFVGNRDVFVMTLAARYADLHNLDTKIVQQAFDSLINQPLINHTQVIQPQIDQPQINQYARTNPIDSHERAIDLHENVAAPNIPQSIKPEEPSVFVAKSATSNEPVPTSAENHQQEHPDQISYSSTSSLSSVSDHQLFDLCLRLKSGALAWQSLANNIPLLQRLISSYIRLGHSATAENCADFVAAIKTQAESSSGPSAFYLVVLQSLIADKLIDLEAIALDVKSNIQSSPSASRATIDAREELKTIENLSVIKDQTAQASAGYDVESNVTGASIITDAITPLSLDVLAEQLQQGKRKPESLNFTGDQFAQLVDIFIAKEKTIAPDIQADLIAAIHQKALQANNKTDYYRRVLKKLLRKETLDFDQVCEHVNQQDISLPTLNHPTLAQPIGAVATASNNIEAIARALLAESAPERWLQTLQLDFAHWQNVVAELIQQTWSIDKDVSAELIEAIQHQARQAINPAHYYRLVIGSILRRETIDRETLTARVNQQPDASGNQQQSIQQNGAAVGSMSLPKAQDVGEYKAEGTGHESITTKTDSRQSNEREIVSSLPLQPVVTTDQITSIVETLLAESAPEQWLQTLQLDLADWQNVVAELIQQSRFIDKDASAELIEAIQHQALQAINPAHYYRLVIVSILKREIVDKETLTARVNQQPDASGNQQQSIEQNGVGIGSLPLPKAQGAGEYEAEVTARESLMTAADSHQTNEREIVSSLPSQQGVTAEQITSIVQTLLAESAPEQWLQTLQLDLAHWQNVVAELIQQTRSIDKDASAELIEAIQHQARQAINPAHYYRLVIAAVIARNPIDLEAFTGAANLANEPIANQLVISPPTASQRISSSITAATDVKSIAQTLLTEPQSWRRVQTLQFDNKQWETLTAELIQQTQFNDQRAGAELIEAIQTQARMAITPTVYYRLVIQALLQQQPIDLEAFAATAIATIDVEQPSPDSGELHNIAREADAVVTTDNSIYQQPHQVDTRQLSGEKPNPGKLDNPILNTELIDTASVLPVNISQNSISSHQVNPDQAMGSPLLTGSDNSLRKPALSLAQLLAAELPLTQEQLLALQQHINALLNRSNQALITEWCELLAVVKHAHVLIHSVPAHLLHQIAMRLQAGRYIWLDALVKLVMEALALLVGDINSLSIKQTKWAFVFHYLFTANKTNSSTAETSARALELSIELCEQLATATGIDDVQRLVNLTQRRIALLKPPAQQKPAMRLQEVTTNPATHSDESTPQWEAGLHINNAGQVLAAAFLPRLFSMLNLMQDGKFIHLGAADRAVHLVQFMVTGQSTTPEYELVLNKILCGIGTSIPVSAGIDITEQEQTLIEQMLNSMIQHWKVLGSTSITGLRETFFQRQGWLVLEEDCWRLKVKEQTFDLLLDRLPWSISLIKHGWMDKPLRVSWRNHS